MYKNEHCMCIVNYFSFPENGKLLQKKFDDPKSCFLQSPETSKKLVKKIKLGDPNLDIQKFNNFPSFWSF